MSVYTSIHDGASVTFKTTSPDGTFQATRLVVCDKNGHTIAEIVIFCQGRNSFGIPDGTYEMAPIPAEAEAAE